MAYWKKDRPVLLLTCYDNDPDDREKIEKFKREHAISMHFIVDASGKSSGFHEALKELATPVQSHSDAASIGLRLMGTRGE